MAIKIAEKSFYVLNSSGTWASSSEGGENVVKESEGTGKIMEEIPETETLESKEVTEDAEPLRNTESE